MNVFHTHIIMLTLQVETSKIQRPIHGATCFDVVHAILEKRISIITVFIQLLFLHG